MTPPPSPAFPKDAPFAGTRLAVADIDLSERPDGSLLIVNRVPLPPYPASIATALVERAAAHPDRPFLCERDGAGNWRVLTYGDAEARSARVAQALLERGFGADTPIAGLCDASISFGILKLAALRAGIPVMPVSPAYSLMSQSFEKLRHVHSLIRPRLYFATRWAPFEKAFELVRGDDVLLVAEDAPAVAGALPFAELEAATPGASLAAAEAAVGPDTVAKILMTSGSTGMPKGVMNTQRMLCSNAVAVDSVWPFLADEPPVLVDWLPWSHTFGTNFNFGQILRHGGTKYIDAGRPAPGRMQATLDNMAEIAPTLLYNVPRGFDVLLPFLEKDEALARNVFGRLQAIFYAGAGLPQALWDRLEALSVRHRGERVPIFSALGSTETAPVATLSFWGSDVTGSVGLPVPGTEIRLVPVAGKREMRVRGPNVTPGYYNDPEATAKAFDEEGFFRLGDAVRFVDEGRPERGLLFDGRVSENFKLLTGTWVHVGSLRLAVLSETAPIVQDAVVAGHDREEVGLILFPNPAGCRQLAPDAPEDEAPERLVARPEVRAALLDALVRHNARNAGASTRIGRVIFTADPPTIDGNEITDKGYINQRAVLANRADLVERLYADTPGDDVLIVPEANGGGRRRAPGNEGEAVHAG